MHIYIMSTHVYVNIYIRGKNVFLYNIDLCVHAKVKRRIYSLTSFKIKDFKTDRTMT